MKYRAAVAAIATALAVSLHPTSAVADPAPYTGVEINHPRNQFVAVPAEFHPELDAVAGAIGLIELRQAMWDINPPFSASRFNLKTFRDEEFGGRLQDVARAVGLDTKEKYATAPRIDPGLMRIAIQRAAEMSPRSYNHVRPANGTCQLGSISKCESVFSATYNGKNAFAENLGLDENVYISTLTGWGHDELDQLRASGGTGDTGGHLHQMINPLNTNYGFAHAALFIDGETLHYTVSAASPFEHIGGTPLPKGVYRGYVYRAAFPGETPTGIKNTFIDPWKGKPIKEPKPTATSTTMTTTSEVPTSAPAASPTPSRSLTTSQLPSTSATPSITNTPGPAPRPTRKFRPFPTTSRTAESTTSSAPTVPQQSSEPSSAQNPGVPDSSQSSTGSILGIVFGVVIVLGGILGWAVQNGMVQIPGF
ncbi:hypothetical protein [Corynebacterium aquatimens]|uniref:SCP domain-containing protein n=1 Tax=Corynebacterium aquatimens TaxID=1190508 RepID=A0A931E1G6_9CORY|nr:hypothetical protein [Corynebacterium aquatimens]MBG6121900.1 hypothetical protein [Corynebacterium aquatimens]WJY65562.1 hypothetical protein CAQUA_04245 [Corynebacterium aquatimens]